MKIFFASDIHGSLPATELMLKQFELSGASWLILLGDLLYHGPRNALPQGYDPAAVATCLNQYAKSIIAVKGNCDSDVDQMLLTFPIMSEWQHILLDSRRLFLTHGHNYGPQNLPPLNVNDILVHGHTHIPRAEKVDDIYYFNPGSITLPKAGFPASFGLLSEKQFHVIALNNNDSIVQISF